MFKGGPTVSLPADPRSHPSKSLEQFKVTPSALSSSFDSLAVDVAPRSNSASGLPFASTSGAWDYSPSLLPDDIGHEYPTVREITPTTKKTKSAIFFLANPNPQPTSPSSQIHDGI